MKPATKSSRRLAFLANKIADLIFEDWYGSTDRSLWTEKRKSLIQRIKQLLEKYKV